MTVDPSDLRASDADREAVADILRAQCAAGRLEVWELEERLSAALAARTLGDLDRLLADFPDGRSTVRVPRRERAAPHTVGLSRASPLPLRRCVRQRPADRVRAGP
jgi:hypothetical protein